MEDHEIHTQVPSMWQPISDPYILAILGKLGEEMSEGATSLFRAIIQGIDEKEPVTHKINRDWIEDEIADVLAMIDHATEKLKLDRNRIRLRQRAKYAFKEPWFYTLGKGRRP